MGIEENKEVSKQFTEAIVKYDTAVIDEVTAENFVFHSLTTGRDLDKETMKQVVSKNISVWGNLTIDINDVVAENNKVILRETAIFNQNGKTVSFARFVMNRLEEGKIAETWLLSDDPGRFQ